MRLIRDLPGNPPLHRMAVAIGGFDGLHHGHSTIIETLLQEAGRRNLNPAVVTFEPSFTEFFRPAEATYRILTIAEKLARIRNLGIRTVICLRTSRRLVNTSAKLFIRDWLGLQMDCHLVIAGEDFRFGKNREGDMRYLAREGSSLDIDSFVVKLVKLHGRRISSTQIRQCLSSGDLVLARELLGQSIAISGNVIAGDKRGRQLGYPTANISLSKRKLLRHGVYAARVSLPDGSRIKSVVNAGIRPTIGGGNRLLEAHLLDWEGNIYQQRLSVELITLIRDEIKFDSLAALRKQIQADCDTAREMLS